MGGECKNSLFADSTKTKQTSERERREESGRNSQTFSIVQHMKKRTKSRTKNPKTQVSRIQCLKQHQITMVIEWKHCLSGDTVC